MHKAQTTTMTRLDIGYMTDRDKNRTQMEHYPVTMETAVEMEGKEE